MLATHRQQATTITSTYSILNRAKRFLSMLEGSSRRHTKEERAYHEGGAAEP